MKATFLQKAIKLYLHCSKRAVLSLLSIHAHVAQVGYTQHPCWAGGWSEDEGVTSQPCVTCDPLSEEERWALDVLRKAKKWR